MQRSPLIPGNLPFQMDWLLINEWPIKCCRKIDVTGISSPGTTLGEQSQLLFRIRKTAIYFSPIITLGLSGFLNGFLNATLNFRNVAAVKLLDENRCQTVE